MKIKIWKYSLAIIEHQSLIVPGFVRLISVAEQRGNLVVYMMVDEEAKTQNAIDIRIVGTGHPADSVYVWEFIGTVKMFDGELMWHVFAKVNPWVPKR